MLRANSSWGKLINHNFEKITREVYIVCDWKGFSRPAG